MKRARSIMLSLGLIIGLLILVFQIVRGLKNIVWQELIIINWYYLGLSMLSACVVVLLQLLNWKLIMAGLKFSIPYSQVLRGYLRSFLPRYITGTVWGYLGRNEWLNRDFSVPYSTSNLASFLEILTAFTSGIILIAFNQLSIFGGKISPFQFIVVLGLPVIIWLLMTTINSIKTRISWIDKILSPGSLDSLSLRRWLGLTGIFLAQWFIYGLILGLISSSFSQESLIVMDRIVEFASSFSISWIGGFLILFAPAGIGFRETLLIGLLTEKLGSPAIATIVAIVDRIILSLAELAGICFSFIVPTKTSKN